MSIPRELSEPLDPFELYSVDFLVSLLQPEDYSVLYELVEYGKDSRFTSTGVFSFWIMKPSSRLKQKEFTQKALEVVHCSHQLSTAQDMFDEVWGKLPDFDQIVSNYSELIHTRYKSSIIDDRIKAAGLWEKYYG